MTHIVHGRHDCFRAGVVGLVVYNELRYLTSGGYDGRRGGQRRLAVRKEQDGQ